MQLVYIHVNGASYHGKYLVLGLNQGSLGANVTFPG